MSLIGAAADFAVSPDRSKLTFGFHGIQKDVDYYRVEGNPTDAARVGYLNRSCCSKDESGAENRGFFGR
jgi:hypothetical protein